VFDREAINQVLKRDTSGFVDDDMIAVIRAIEARSRASAGEPQ
jgi:hypothetical protein